MTDLPAHNATVVIDADNTLWDTDGVFRNAQTALLEAVQREIAYAGHLDDQLTYVREVDQALAENHHAGLRYPPALLIRALANRLRGVHTKDAVHQALRGDHSGVSSEIVTQIEASYLEKLRVIPELRPGVAGGIETLHRSRRLLIVLTEGAHARVDRSARLLGLRSAFDKILEAPKTQRFFQKIRTLSRAPAPFFMVGDQLQRDISPAKAAGFITVYFPGNFRPRWEPELERAQPHHVISSFQQVADIVDAHAPTLAPPSSRLP